METLAAVQRWIYASITADLGAIATSSNWITLLAILPLGIVFGSIHALTPGHGKSILASYIVGSRIRMTSSTAMALALSLTHVASAVVIATTANFLISRSIGTAGRAPSLEVVSRSILILIGLALVVRACRDTTPVDHRSAVLTGLAAGLVPCPLTLFVMFFAQVRGIALAGLAFAVAMMLGIALTLISVAFAAVFARDTFTDFLKRYGGAAAMIGRSINIGGGLTLVAAGLWGLVR